MKQKGIKGQAILFERRLPNISLRKTKRAARTDKNREREG